MNKRIIKETRALLPVFGVTVLAAIAPPLIWSRETATVAGNIIFSICCVIMGASCFGNEYQWRTMPLLLAQPVSRRRIWNEKMLVLGAALALGLILFLFCLPPRDADTCVYLVLLPFCVLSAAPWLTLNVKNTLASAACTFGLPVSLCATLSLIVWIFSHYFPTTAKLLNDSIEIHTYRWLCGAVAIYCVASYRLGYVQFMKLQAVDSQSREVALPARLEAFLARGLKGLMPRYSGPWASLFRKELQLQKTSFLIAGVTCIVSLLSSLAWDGYHSDVFMGTAFAMIAILVFVIPLIVPGICVAEERNWGVSGWQRALPVSARKQWTAKMLTVVFTCVLVGMMLPAATWFIEGWVFHLPNGVERWHSATGGPASNGGDLTGMIIWFCIYWLVCVLGVFSSSVCTSPVKAIIMTIALMAAAAALTVKLSSITNQVIQVHLVVNPGTHGSWIPIILTFLIPAGLVHYLAYKNFRKGEPGMRPLWIQLATVVGSIGFILAICASLF